MQAAQIADLQKKADDASAARTAAESTRETLQVRAVNPHSMALYPAASTRRLEREPPQSAVERKLNLYQRYKNLDLCILYNTQLSDRVGRVGASRACHIRGDIRY